MEDKQKTEVASSFDQLLTVLGHNKGSRKLRRLNSSETRESDPSETLWASFADEDKSDFEDDNETPSCEGIITDGINTFDMPYEEYLNDTEQTASDSVTSLPFFKGCKLRFLTPVLSQLIRASALPDIAKNENHFGLNPAVLNNLLKQNIKAGSALSTLKNRKRLRYLFNCMNSYVDVFYSGCKIGDISSVRFLYALHTANHVSKCSSSTVEKSHGFTRSRVLYVCGLKSNARDFIYHLTKLLSIKKEDPKYDKFKEEYNLPKEDKAGQEASFQKTKKSFDFIETFSGNQEDAFKIGLQYKGGRLRLYSPFYTSDIIVASPLGLKIMIQENDYDFLSSIEVLLIDRLDLIKFQNWRFLLELLEKVNLPLTKWRDADLTKLRESTIDGHIKLYRQTVAVACTEHSLFNALFRRFENKRGLIKLASKPTTDFVLLGSQLKVQQLFIKVAATTVKDCEGELIKYFLKNMLNSVQGIAGVLIVLGDYTHFLRMSKEFQFANFEYLPCHESCTGKQMLFARQQFQAACKKSNLPLGKAPVLVTTSRLLFFKRYVIKGTCRVFFVIPPDYPDLYREVFKMLNLSNKCSIVTLYTKFHGNQLEPIVGEDKLKRLLSASDTKVTEFH